jgi:hypothetical protein
MNLPLGPGKVQTGETDRQGGIFALVKICGIWTLATDFSPSFVLEH